MNGQACRVTDSDSPTHAVLDKLRAESVVTITGDVDAGQHVVVPS